MATGIAADYGYRDATELARKRKQAQERNERALAQAREAVREWRRTGRTHYLEQPPGNRKEACE